MAHDPLMRASDADRENVVTALREHTVAGRLTQDEFDERMRAAYGAKTFGELAELTRDLPVDLGQQAGAAGTGTENGPVDLADHHSAPPRISLMRYGPVAALGGVFLVNTAIWAVVSATSGHLVHFWPVWLMIPLAVALTRGLRGGHPHGHRHELLAERRRMLDDLRAYRNDLRDQARDSQRAMRHDLRRQRRQRL